ncbi:uncharacterized GTP-binding protein YGR210C-like [Pecten maximus]|uniref:uncharacterized GTP-binding protein YGR210C-like n=1 Tax=Pecten maximus TaxID=6579 RepID=UPI00145810D9|nr:uncharacterized GTP-binding protein YGR210C-like [Pecten maximus]
MANDDQIEELEALRAIYDTEFTELTSNPPCFMIKLTDLTVQLAGQVNIKFTLPNGYPAEMPIFELPMRSRVLTSDQVSSILQELRVCAEENVGMPMIYSLVDAAQHWINENVSEVTDTVKEEEDEIEDVTIHTVKLEEPKVSGGRWEYVIGLVGKPSAGKSTFFNAATTVDLAKTGAHPFTTIEPNIGKAFYSIDCPCDRLDKLCDAAHGHNFRGKRHVPVLLKDVAGLVPGAWEGKGRGNKFLNDLLDADVLIHVIDASGTTNEKGEETQGYDPANDIRWLQQEIHQWIFQNVWSRWDSITKRPSKLIDMFTGYHANRATIHSALHNAGIGDRELGAIAGWKESVLHQIVDHFLRLRFPMLLVLNKADKPEANTIIQRIQTDMDGLKSIAVSARTECLLQKLSKEGVVQYDYGNGEFQVVSDTQRTIAELQQVSTAIFKRYGSTNVHEALCEAVRLRPPTYAFPVHCLDTLRSVGRSPREAVLRDCVSLRPGTRVEELHTVLCHYPINLLSGDFVRAETMTEDRKLKPLRKDEVITQCNNIIKIMTNRRTS